MSVHTGAESQRPKPQKPLESRSPAIHDDGTSPNEVVNSTRDPIDDSAPGATFMLVGMSYPIIAAIVALIIAAGIWIARSTGG